jgi:zinc D-Ala-D-Ala carboxypeptidase
MQLTQHFSDQELGVVGCDQQLIDNATALCEKLLEPIRAHFNAPVRVHDGYRDSWHNLRVGGKPASWHLFEAGHAAADFHVVGFDLQFVFKWIRLESALPFDKVILEVSGGRPACIHIQVDASESPRRLAYTGSTGAGKDYDPVEVA